MFRKRLYVFKYPRERGYFAYKKWFFHTRKEILFLKEYAPARCQILLPKILEVSDSCIVQQKVSGFPLSAEIYEKLPISDQHQITHRLASFFLKLHTKTTQQTPAKKHKPALKKCWELWDDEEKDLFQHYRLLLRENPIHPAPSCLCITDLKDNHILYDSQTKTVGLVDFGSIHFDTPENEFILKNPIRSHLSFRMIKDIIIAYNDLAKSPIISWNRIKFQTVLCALNEVYGSYLGQTISPKEKKRLKHILFDFVKKLESIPDT